MKTSLGDNGQYTAYFKNQDCILTITVNADNDEHAQKMSERILKQVTSCPHRWKFDGCDYLCP
jgi:hypothetical protein